jgi:hypothetical protein
MHNHLWSLSAFTVAATLSLGTTDAEAKKTSKPHPVVPTLTAYDINTKDCPESPPAISKKDWGWKNARLTVLYTQQDDGSYKAEELPDAKNADERLPIASIAKFMTALVIFDLIDKDKFSLDQKIAVTKESLCLRKSDNYFAVKGLPAGITEIDGQHAMGQMIKLSSNTMAVNFAIAVAGSVENFVTLMNAKAKAWGMHDTDFETPDGLPKGDRKAGRTTVRDMAIMAAHGLPYMERFKHYESAPLQTWTIREGSHRGKEKLNNLGAVYKTGTIDQCASLLTIVGYDAYKIGSFQLCGTRETRFQIAVETITSTLKRIAGMGIPSAMASPRNEVPQTPNSGAVSLRPTHPLGP